MTTGVLVLALCGAGCGGSGQQSLTLETSSGYTFVRNHGSWNNDNVLYQGQLTVGRDKCLYIDIDNYPGHRYLVVLGAESYVIGDGLSTRSSGRVLFNSRGQFGRDSDPAWYSMKSDFLKSCAEAHDLWGVG